MKKIVKCPAKINLTLEVIGKKPDGFHELRTVMLKSSNLNDDISIEVSSSGNEIFVKCDKENVPSDENNICYKAAKLFLKNIKKKAKVDIEIKKRIPVGAGLGGGSSNAAAVFLFLNEYFENYFSKNELIKMAAEVGKDVPVFLSAKRGALIKGAGEKIEKEFDFKEGHFLVVNPGVHISTPEAFGWVDEELWFMEDQNRIDITDKFLTNLDNNFERYFYNDFEVSVEKRYPIIKELKESLIAFGAEGALMSGSGSTVFGYFKNKSKALKTKRVLGKKYKNFLIELF